jgi:hypothetical protein
VNLDWASLRVVVLESDDWGLCAWAPDDQAYRVLADTPAWRGPAGRIYGRSTLESAADVAGLVSTLKEFRGGDGFPPVWQANTILAAPDFEQLVPPLFPVDTLPLVFLPDAPTRWHRPGMWEEVTRAREAGVWWPELHGLHHLPAAAWLAALRRGVADARRACEQRSVVCEIALQSSEYDPSEPLEQRSRNLELAVERFRALFGRAPSSLCPPSYRWDVWLEDAAERLGITTLQGKSEQEGRPFPRIARLLDRYRWPDLHGKRLYLPIRIAFEPRGGPGDGPVGVDAVHRAVRAAWKRGQPAVVSTHRANYAHLDPAWSEHGRAALRDLLGRLSADRARFLTDAEIHSLVERGWSARGIGERDALVRFYGVPGDPLELAAPPGASEVAVKAARAEGARLNLEGGVVKAQLDPGEYLLEWSRE